MLKLINNVVLKFLKTTKLEIKNFDLCLLKNIL